MSSRELPFQTIRVWLVAAVGRENIISRTMPGSAIQWSRMEFSPLISSPCSTIHCCTVSQGTDIYHYTAKCPFQQRPQKVDARFTCHNLNQALSVAQASWQSCSGSILWPLDVITKYLCWIEVWALNWPLPKVDFFEIFEAILCDGVLDHCSVVSLTFYSTYRRSQINLNNFLKTWDLIFLLNNCKLASP